MPVHLFWKKVLSTALLAAIDRSWENGLQVQDESLIVACIFYSQDLG